MRPIDLHTEFMTHCFNIRRNHIYQDIDDNSEYFDLAGFLFELEQIVSAVLSREDSPVGNYFKASAHEITRYVYCCFALERGDSPSGDTLRGIPIAD